MSRKTITGVPLFQAKANGKELQLEVYDTIGRGFFEDGVTAQAVADALKTSHESVTLRINSPGGDAYEGVAIFNLLKSHGKPVNVIVDGLAASAAATIAMAGDTITMGRGTSIMIHGAQTVAGGFASDLRQAADVLDKVTGNMADIYAARSNQSKAQVIDWMSAETWMTPDEAIARGFATAKSDQQVAACAFDLSPFKYKNAPVENRLGHTKEVDGENLKPEDFIYVGNSEETDTWHLPWHFSTEEKTKSHLRDALARFDQTAIPPTKKAAAKEKLVGLCKEHGIEVSGPTTAQADAPIVNETEYTIDIMRKKLSLQRNR
jgi:ATP-dependent Clp protease, protease subunit